MDIEKSEHVVDTDDMVNVIRTTVIAQAVSAVGAADDAQLAAAVGLAFVRVREQLLGVTVEGYAAKTHGRTKSELRQLVLAGMVKDGRAIRKGEEIPPNVDADAYAEETRVRDLRNSIRLMLDLADRLAIKVWRDFHLSLVGIVQSANNEEGALTQFRNFVKERLKARSLTQLETFLTLGLNRPDRKLRKQKDWSDRVKGWMSPDALKARQPEEISSDAFRAASALLPYMNDEDLSALIDSTQATRKARTPGNQTPPEAASPSFEVSLSESSSPPVMAME